MSKTLKTVLTVLTVIYILLGLVLIIWPLESRLAICYVLGGLSCIYGIGRIVAYFMGKNGEMRFGVGVALGIALTVAGLLLIFRANAIAAGFGILVGIAVIANSILILQLALNIKRFGDNKWLIALIASLVMLCIGIVLLFNPFTAINVATIISGIALLMDGIMTLWSLTVSLKLLK